MNLKMILLMKGISQIELAKKVGANPGLINLQVNKHRLLPKKYLQNFAQFLKLIRVSWKKS